MGVVVKPGLVIPAGTNLKSGKSAKGAWAFALVKAQKGYDTIKVWASNAEDIIGALAIEVVSIDAVELKSRLDEKSGKWFKDYSFTATVRECEVPKGKDEDFVPTDEEDINNLFGLNF